MTDNLILQARKIQIRQLAEIVSPFPDTSICEMLSTQGIHHCTKEYCTGVKLNPSFHNSLCLSDIQNLWYDPSSIHIINPTRWIKDITIPINGMLSFILGTNIRYLYSILFLLHIQEPKKIWIQYSIRKNILGLEEVKAPMHIFVYDRRVFEVIADPFIDEWDEKTSFPLLAERVKAFQSILPKQRKIPNKLAIYDIHNIPIDLSTLLYKSFPQVKHIKMGKYITAENKKIGAEYTENLIASLQEKYDVLKLFVTAFYVLDLPGLKDSKPLIEIRVLPIILEFAAITK
jgi:hypothetical protein